jgi:hypothetical protein
MGTYTDLCRRYLWFTPKEFKAVVISVLALTLIVAFNDKSESFELGRWISNFLIWLLVVLVSFMVHQFGHRLLALKIGYKVEYTLWWYGIGIGLIVMFVSGGRWWVLVPGGIWAHHMPVHRLGRFRYGPNVLSFAMISLFGPLASIAFGSFFKTLEVWFGFSLLGPGFVSRIFLFNMALAAYALLPIPPLAGSRLLFQSRLTYAFVFGAVAGYAILAFNGIFSFIYALLIGGLVWLLFLVFFELKAWKL